MKKAIIIAALGVSSSLATYAQGVFFGNYINSSQLTGVIFANGPLAGQGVGSEFTAQLLQGAAGASSYGQLSAVGSPLTFVTSLGYDPLPSGAPIGNGSGAGWFGTSTVSWGSYNTQYSLAILVTGTYLGTVYTGYSDIVQFTSQASSGNPIPNLPAGLRSTTFSVSAAPVPEPSTLALAGLGGFGMLMALRRKKA